MDHSAHKSKRGSFVALAVTIVLLLLPAAVLAVIAHRLDSKLLLVGAIAQVLGSALLVRSRVAWQPPASGVVIALYLLALGWLWFASHDSPDPLARFGRGVLLLAAVGLLVIHDMTRTGLEPRRRARILTRRLVGRTQWPRTPAEFSYLPEVRSLSAVIRDDPTLAFDLFDDPRPEVHAAALHALQGRPYWRWEEAAVVLGVAKKTLVPEVRALAVRAIASADNIDLTFGVGEYLKDPSPEVRAAACECLLAGGDRRWAVARGAIRTALADPTFLSDGPLAGAAGRLPAIAVCDLTGWTAEPAPLAERAVRTLLTHYATILQNGTAPGLAAELGRQVTDEETPPLLRIELATLLRQLALLSVDLLDRMTDADQPSPIRLTAVEVLLASTPTHSSALDVLRGLGRQQNRETALVIARILQQYANLDFGLPAAGWTPKVAAEVAHRVHKWATGKIGTDSGQAAGPGSGYGKGLLDDEDALGGLPDSYYPASVPGISSPRLKPKTR